MARLLRFVAVAALVGGATAVLSACSDSVDPVVSESPSVPVVVTPSPTVSPTPTALTDEELLELIPESSRAENFGGAANFAGFFVREYQRMFAEHDSALFAFVSGEECQFCASSLQSFAEDEAAGSTVTGGEITPDVDRALGGLQDDGTWLIQFPMSVAEANYFNADGSLRTAVAATNYDVGVLLEWQATHWSVLGLNLEVAG